MEEKKITQPTLKISILGDSGIGKSCIICRFIDNIFDDYSLPTIGVEFFSKKILVDDELYKMHIFDLAGQERFKSIVTSYYRQNHGIILAFDITNRESFNNLKRWIVEIDKYSDPFVSIILIGTKLDLEKDRKITYEEAKKYADELKINYYEVSSKDNINIENIFIDIVRQIKIILKISEKIENENKIKLQKNFRKLKYCC